MAIAIYTVRVETNYGDYMEFEHEYEFDPIDGEPFDPADIGVERDIYNEVISNLYVDLDFVRIAD